MPAYSPHHGPDGTPTCEAMREGQGRCGLGEFLGCVAEIAIVVVLVIAAWMVLTSQGWM